MKFSFSHFRLKKSTGTIILAVALAGALTGVLLEHLKSFEVLELKSLDFRFQQASHPEWADTSIVLVSIDQNSLDFYATQHVSWPWPREFYALLVDYLSMGGAKVIAFDMDFANRDLDRLETDAQESDRSFAEALARSSNAVLGTHLSIREAGDQLGNLIDSRHLTRNFDRSVSPVIYTRATAPLPEFQSAAQRLGIINFETDPDDIARRIPLGFRFEDAVLPYFGVACFSLSTRTSLSRLDSLLADVPTSPDESFLFYWYGKGGPSGAFKYYSVHSLIHSARKIKMGIQPDVSPEEFRGKHVIIGGSAAGLYDFKPTPFTSLELYPGMEIHATMLSNLLNRHFLLQPSGWLSDILTFVLALVVSIIFFRSKNIIVGVLSILFVGIAYFAGTIWLFYQKLWWLPVVTPLLSMVATFVFAAVISYATEGKQKREMRKAFNRYLNPHVVTGILENTEQVELGGKTLEGTVFFSDIKNFTNIAEGLSPKELVALLNEYFSLASNIILEEEAMVDKYIGDAIMAIFGAPIPRADHAKVACLTSLKVQRALTAHYHGQAGQSNPIFETRIGLHTGRMIVGNIGSTNRLDYTAIGDTVNLASRLEGVNKIFGTKIIISESTFEQAKDSIEVRELDLLRVKGKQVPIRIYELLGEKNSLTASENMKMGQFAEALGLYKTKKFGAAQKVFLKILLHHPDDGPSANYVIRCKRLAKEKLPSPWDGVFTLTTK
jgi:adenylate cyclase